jgi:molybdate transport system substrate-binding protein
MKRALLLVLILLASASGLILWLQRKDSGKKTPALMVFCAVNLKNPVESCASQFQRETGMEVQLQFGGSGTLLNQLRLARTGDLYIAADDGWMADAKRLGLTGDTVALAEQHPVIAVRTGNPKGVRALADLLRADVRVALANPEAASIGRATKAVLGEKWAPLAAQAAVMKPTVTDIASDLTLGAVDAAIVWDTTVPQFKALEAVEVPELSKQREHASAAVLVWSQQPESALRFARWMTAADKGEPIFRKHGFTPAQAK